MKSYFFIPGHKKKYLDKFKDLDSDFFIIDLEDSITNDSINHALKNLASINNNRDKLWIRIPLKLFKTKEIKEIRDLGYNKFVIPKLIEIEQFESIVDNDEKYIILIENPKILLNCEKLVEKYKDIIHGISLGSHDYAAEMNMKHTNKNLNFARFYILHIAKAYGVEAIDIAEMEIVDNNFLNEVFIDSFETGFDGKYFIHPNQLKLFNEIKFYSDEEIEEAKQIISIIDGKKDFEAFYFNGRVFEKPHLKRIMDIIKFSEEHDKI